MSVMPGARRFRMVTMMLIAPMMDEAPRMWTAKMVKSMPGPICSESGAYMVQPAAWAPPGTKNDTVQSVAPTGSRQKLKLVMRQKARSDEPVKSEERRGGKECVSTRDYRWSRKHTKTKNNSK